MAKTLARALILFAIALAPVAVKAEDVVLVPGYISGTVSVEGQMVSSVSVHASWTSPDGTIYSSSTNVNSGSSYTLTVNVPEGSMPTYSVSATANLSGGQSLSFPAQDVSVTASNTSIVNFSMTPGYISASVTSTVPGSLNYAYFYYSGGYASAPTGAATFPVAPGSSFVYGYAYFTDGSSAFLDFQYPTVVAGATTSVSWETTPPPPPDKGSLSGTFHFNGATPDNSYVTASGPTYTSQSVANNDSFTIPDLSVGNYSVLAYLYFGNAYLQLPDSAYSPSKSVNITAGATTNVDINANAAFMTGTLALTGSAALSQASSVSMTA